MPDSLYTGARYKVTIDAEHRSGKCENCGQTTEVVMVEGKPRPLCPKCGGQGELIARVYSVQPPDPPQCLAFKCIMKFMYESLFSTFLASYHRRRVAYAEANRHKKILERYRTGEPSPKNLWQAIHANIKLKCPVCRRYNVDPFLFSK
jgi:hypothetical protein